MSSARSANVNGEIAEVLDGIDALDQRAVDLAMVDADGTPNKARLGANAILGVSLATAKAAADELGLPLFRYVGRRRCPRAARPDDERAQRRRARRQLDRPPGVHDHAGRGRLLLRGAALGGRDLPRAWPRCLKVRGLSTAVGDEGGFAPNLAVQRGRRPDPGRGHRGGRAGPRRTTSPSPWIPASSELYKDGNYVLAGEGRSLSSAEMVEYWVDLVDRYPIVSIEDGMAEDDWDGLGGADRSRRRRGSSWSATTCSSPTRSGCGGASTAGTANAILIKVNQIGTLTETLGHHGAGHPVRRTRV